MLIDFVDLSVFLSDLSVFLSGLPLAPTTIHCDNLGTVHTANNPVTKAKSSKHLALRYFRVRDFIESGDLLVHHCRTNDNLAAASTPPCPSVWSHAFCEHF